MQKTVLPYKIGNWTIDPERGLARGQDQDIHLEPRVTELLNYLASRSGQVVSRAELLDAVWPGVIVGDDVLTNTVAKLRRSLGDDPKSPELIQTIPKRGYRIVTAEESPGSEKSQSEVVSAWWIALLAVLVITVGLVLTRPWAPGMETTPVGKEAFVLPDKPSIAVLPFDNLSDDEGQDYFVDGMTEDLITDLSRVSGLFVIARNSSFSYKGKSLDVREIGHELGVRNVIEGSVRKVGNKLRINVQLIDTETGAHLWAERYDGDVDGLFMFQDQIIEKIVSALSVEMTGIEKDYAAFQETHKHSAYEAFLKGWALYRKGTPEGFAGAIVHFEKAVEEDPAYGRALAALSSIYWESYHKRWYRRLGVSPLSLAWQRANEYLEKSMVAPTPLAHKIASAMLVTNRRYDEAISEAERAIAIDSNDPLGYVALAEALIFTGSAEQAESLIQKAIRLDPQDPATYLAVLGKSQLIQGKFGDASLSLKRATQRNPDNRLAWMALISAYGLLGKTEEAGSAIRMLNNLQRRDKLVSFTVANAREHWPFKSKADQEQFLEGLRKAGVPKW